MYGMHNVANLGKKLQYYFKLKQLQHETVYPCSTSYVLVCKFP